MLQKNFTKVLQNRLLGNTKLILFIIVIFGLLLRMSFFSGMSVSDDLAYSKYAHQIDKIEPNTLAVRIGIIYATALFHSLFGINDFSSVLFVLLTSVGGIILIFYFGRLFFNDKVGLMAAFLLSFFPMDVVYSTKLLTDTPSAFFMALGVYFFLYSEKKSKLKYEMGYFLSGVFIGIGYMIRESVLLIGLFFLVYATCKKKIKKEYFIAAVGFLTIFAIESLIFYTLTGNPLFRSIASQHLVKVMIEHNYYGRLSFPIGLLHYPYIILTTHLISYFYVFIFFAIAYFWVYKKKETSIMQFWFISLLLYLNFGSASLTKYVPFIAKDRYLTIITIPGLLLLAYFLSEKKTLIKRIVMPLTLVVLISTSFYSIYSYEDRGVLDNLRETRPILENLGKTIYIDSRSIIALDYISGYKNTISLEAYPDNLKEIKDSYIVINREMIARLRYVNKNTKFPEEIDNPPESWIKIKEIGKEDKDKIIIYYIP